MIWNGFSLGLYFKKQGGDDDGQHITHKNFDADISHVVVYHI